MIDVLMPRLSDSMEEGVIITWLVEEGAEISEGDELAEVETDKATMIFEADAGGLIHIVAAEGDSLPVGGLVAQLLDPGEEPPADAGRPEGSLSPSQPPAAAAAPPEGEEAKESGDVAKAPSADEPEDETGGRTKASPLARRLAAESGVELGTLQGSGPGGRIIKVDVERAAASADKTGSSRTAKATAPSGKGEVEVVEVNRLQQTVARRMSESKATIPHFYVSTEVDMGLCVDARQRLKESAAEGAIVPSFNDMVVKACAIALGEFPNVNGAFVDGHWEFYSRINIGLAVATEGALVVPVIPDVDQLGLVAIASAARELAAKVRDGSITPPELSGGTFTVSNLGMFGVSDFSAVVNPGQAAILAVGAIEGKPVVRDGELVAGKVMTLTISSDHRVLYGADSAVFLARVKAILEEPLSLAL